jgi:hypothetical protein
MLRYLTGQALSATETNINERVNYTANTGTALLSTANSNLDGTGTKATVLTPASNGTLIKTITVKGRGNVTRGMVRLFLTNTELGTSVLLDEIDIPGVAQTGTQDAFEIVYEVNYYLAAGTYTLTASTEKAENFIVVAEGLDMTYP